MGGYGSGRRWYSTKTTAEDCHKVDANDFACRKGFKPGVGQGTIKWTRGGRERASCGYYAVLSGDRASVVSGSTMPISRVQQREEALALYKEQAIDQTELLDKLDWSNRSEVVKRMMAGPLGQVLEKLMKAQVPEPILDYIKAVGLADPKDLQKALEKGEIPPFMAFMQKIMAQMQGQQAGPDAAQTEQAGAMKEIEAKVEKAVAEIGLINEKAVTERINQTVALAGIGYDDDMMKIKRAEVIHQMEEDAKGHHEAGVKAGMDFVRETHKTMTGAALEKEKIDKAGRAGFNDKSLKSDNKK